MERSGGKAGRPLSHLPVEQIEALVTKAGGDVDELRVAMVELGFRRSKRAVALRDLVTRLLDERQKLANGPAGPLFD